MSVKTRVRATSETVVGDVEIQHQRHRLKSGLLLIDTGPGLFINTQVRPPARSADYTDPVSSPLKKYPCIGVTFEIGDTKPLKKYPCIGVTFEIGGTKPTVRRPGRQTGPVASPVVYY